MVYCYRDILFLAPLYIQHFLVTMVMVLVIIMSHKKNFSIFSLCLTLKINEDCSPDRKPWWDFCQMIIVIIIIIITCLLLTIFLLLISTNGFVFNKLPQILNYVSMNNPSFMFLRTSITLQQENKHYKHVLKVLHFTFIFGYNNFMSYCIIIHDVKI